MNKVILSLYFFCAAWSAPVVSAPISPPGMPSASVSANSAPAVLEIAVIHKHEARLLLWPMWSVPSRKVAGAAPLNPCPGFVMECPLARQKVMRLLHMRAMPEQWIAADGSVFATDSGYYVNNLLGGLSDDFLGFTLRGKHHAGNVTVSNIPGVFAQMTRRKLSTLRGMDYGKPVIDKWKRAYLLTCGEQCDAHLKDISDADNLAGTLTEYKLAGSRVLQFLDVSSLAFVSQQERQRNSADRVYQSWLHHALWRIVEPEGKTTLLHAGPELVPYDCEGNCVFSWDVPPDVIEHGNTIRVVGKGRQGEVSGYFVYQFNKGKMELVASMSGGS